MIQTFPDYDLSRRNTFGMKVKCARWIDFDSPDSLPELRLGSDGQKWKVVGEGSNLLFTGDYSGTILHSAIRGIRISDVGSDGFRRVWVGSGECLDSVAALLASRGLWGAENLSGIPGQVGAGAVQNVGAYGVEMKDILESVEAFDVEANRMVVFNVNECEYAYRDSRFKHSPDSGRYIITAVTLKVTDRPSPRLSYGSLDKVVASFAPTPTEVREAVIAVRHAKLPDVARQPFCFPSFSDPSDPWPQAAGSAGSYFRNPVVPADLYSSVVEKAEGVAVPHFLLPGGMVKIPAAWLIDRCGLKGYRTGNVGVWHLQPLILVNLTGNAVPEEILALEKTVVDAVDARFSIRLSPEVEKIGK